MNNTSPSINSFKKNIIKPCIEIGTHKVMILDRSIVKALKIADENTVYFEQELTEDGIVLLKLRKIDDDIKSRENIE
ncbi:MAG TPA: hypothetical protein VK882_00135 [Nitrososphaeraceae archaeon]|nr:hypothetical protein [Nitrososphaeraceae archaeon]